MHKLYKNIKAYRVKKGLTQEELALKMGYSGKSAIAKVEQGLVDLPVSKVSRFAEVLDTDVRTLMGWDGKTEVETFNLNDYEKRLLAYCKYLNPTGQSKVVAQAAELSTDPSFQSVDRQKEYIKKLEELGLIEKVKKGGE